jgi:hypothetical protein
MSRPWGLGCDRRRVPLSRTGSAIDKKRLLPCDPVGAISPPHPSERCGLRRRGALHRLCSVYHAEPARVDSSGRPMLPYSCYREMRLIPGGAGFHCRGAQTPGRVRVIASSGGFPDRGGRVVDAKRRKAASSGSSFRKALLSTRGEASRLRPLSAPPLAVARTSNGLRLGLATGEVHFLWHFIQGSVMNPETRTSLRRAWGMCERHGFGFVAVEAAFRTRFLHGSAVLYEDLMERAETALGDGGPVGTVRAVRRLRTTGPCLMCDLGYGAASEGYIPPGLMEPATNLEPLRAFAEAAAPHWRETVCGRCAGTGTPIRCRVHLREDLARGAARLVEHARLIRDVAERMRRYARSFRWENRGTDTSRDRAALVSAVGWCGGWRPWLALCEEYHGA